MFVVYEKDEKEVRFFESFFEVCEHLVEEVLLELNDFNSAEKTHELYREGLMALNRSMASRNIEIDWVGKGQPFYV